MVGAVRQGDGHVRHRKAQRPAFQCVASTLLHGGDPMSGDDAAGDAIGELEPFSAGQGPDLEHDVGELAMAAGLLLVPSALRHGPLDGFAVGHPWAREQHIDAVAALQPLEGGAQVRLSLSLQHDLAGVGVVHQPQPPILLHQLGHGGREPNVVLLVLGRDGESVNGTAGLRGGLSPARLAVAGQ